MHVSYAVCCVDPMRLARVPFLFVFLVMRLSSAHSIDERVVWKTVDNRSSGRLTEKASILLGACRDSDRKP